MPEQSGTESIQDSSSFQEGRPSIDLSSRQDDVVVPEITVDEPHRYEVVAEHHEAPKELEETS